MTRPAVIIGLGGTGQWVTTYVKKELLEDNQGKLPDNVRLLCFDTWPDANVGGEENTLAEVVSIGNTKLELNVEFVPLRGDTFAKGEAVVQGSAPHIGKRISEMGDAYTWLDAPYLRQKVSRNLWHLNIGAGQIRQFGRLGFFEHATEIRANINRAFTEVANHNPSNQEAQVMIIASFAGGTGAGMFIDMAVMVRSLVSLFGQGGAMVRGIFVLPGTFKNGVDTEGQRMQARAYAAWRELARYMNLGPDHGAHSIRYDNHTEVAVESKPFDQVFLVDANRPQHAFTNTRPENGVFPAIATYISTALDDDAGMELGNAINRIKDIFNNRLGFSSFGAYGVYLPITHIVNEYALQLDRDLLRRWLAPTIRMKDGVEEIIGLQPDQAVEKSGTRGSQEVKPFMTAPRHQLAAVVNRSEPDKANPTQTLESSKVLAAIYDLYEACTTGQYGGKVGDDAKGGYCSPDADQKVNLNSWLGRMLIPGDHDKTTVIGSNGKQQIVDPAMLTAEVNSTVRGAVPSSRDQGCDPTIDECNRIIAAVENDQNGFIVKHYGVQGGRGSFDTELDKLYSFNCARFKQILTIDLLNLLNGTVADVYQGFTGRLGYAEEFLATLFTALEWYQREHLVAVKQKRTQERFEVDAHSILETARSEMAENAGKKCVFFFNHPRAHNKQDEYLEAAQSYCEVLKDEKLIRALDRLTNNMKETVGQALEEVRAWKKALLTDPNSLYATVQADYAHIKQDIDVQAKANQSQKLQILRDYPADYTKSPDVLQRIDDQLKRIRWTISDGNSFKLGCEVFDNNAYTPLLNENDDQGYNKALIGEIGKMAWATFGVDHKLLDEIGRAGTPNYRDPDKLGLEMVDHSIPMYESAVPGAGIKSALRRAYVASDLPGFNPAGYMTRLDAQSQTITPPLDATIGYDKSSSRNPHKLTMIQWVDRLAETDFSIYNRLRDSYRRQIQSGDGHETASRLHIFQAEGNAAFYEHHLPIWLGQAVRELSPRVVLLMTEVERVRWFFQCYALGMIMHGKHEAKPGRWWRLVIPVDGEVLGHDILFYNSDSMAIPDPFDLINRFVTGRDVITNTPINWDSVRLAVHRACLKLQMTGVKERVDAQFAPEQGKLPEFAYETPGLVLDEPIRLVHELKTKGQAYFTDYLSAHGQTEESNPGWTWVRHEDYKDLSDVARMMYIETLLLEDAIDTTKLANSLYRR